MLFSPLFAVPICFFTLQRPNIVFFLFVSLDRQMVHSVAERGVHCVVVLLWLNALVFVRADQAFVGAAANGSLVLRPAAGGWHGVPVAGGPVGGHRGAPKKQAVYSYGRQHQVRCRGCYKSVGRWSPGAQQQNIRHSAICNFGAHHRPRHQSRRCHQHYRTERCRKMAWRGAGRQRQNLWDPISFKLGANHRSNHKHGGRDQHHGVRRDYPQVDWRCPCEQQ